MSIRRRLACKLCAQALRIAPRSDWAAAMRNELDYLEHDGEALAWSAGCLRTSIMERLHFPGTRAVRVLLMIPVALLALNDIFAPAITAAYRSGAFELTRGLGRMTPGDDYARLIPLMENLPLWLLALPTAAAALYGVTILQLLGRRRVSWIPVALAIALDAAAEIFGRPVIDAIGVRANPNPSLVAWLLPAVLPFLLALYLWRMSPPPAQN